MATPNTVQMGTRQLLVLDYIRAHPGCHADVLFAACWPEPASKEQEASRWKDCVIILKALRWRRLVVAPPLCEGGGWYAVEAPA